MNNFDLKKFLVENKLTANSKMLSEAAEKPTIKILKDLYYFDKLGSLGALADVDEKYHSGAKLVFKKGKSVADDTTHDDSEYKMITSSKRLEKGVDYEVNENNLTRASKTLIKEAMSMNDLDSMKIVTDEYLAEKGIQVNPSEDGSGQELLDMLNPPLISTIEADEDEGGADSYNVYDLGEGHLLVIDDYEGQFGIYRKAGGMNENLNFSGGEKAAEEFDIDANNGVGIADFLKSMLGHYERIAGEEAVFYELSSEDAAILKMLGFNHLNGEEEELAEYDIKSTGEEEIIYEVEVLDEDGKIKSYTKLNAEKFDLYIKNRPLPVTIKFKNRTVRAVTKITGVTDDMGRPMNL